MLLVFSNDRFGFNWMCDDYKIPVDWKIGKGFEAHHTIPQKFRPFFEKMGINIDKPGNVVWREAKGHRNKSNGLTKDWNRFMSNKNNKPTKKQVYKFRDQMEKKHFGNKSDTPQN